jgi:hypothetical protein
MHEFMIIRNSRDEGKEMGVVGRFSKHRIFFPAPNKNFNRLVETAS